jgi:hypothetical protein
VNAALILVPDRDVRVLSVHSACKNFAGLIVVCLFLGGFETASAPALLIIMGMWYKRTKHPLRVGI